MIWLDVKIDVSIAGLNLAIQKNDGIDTIMDNYINNKSTAQNIKNKVVIKELVLKCGNPTSDKLFT